MTEVEVGDISLKPVRVGRRWYIQWSCVAPSLSRDLAAWRRFRAKHAAGKDATGYFFQKPESVIQEFADRRRCS